MVDTVTQRFASIAVFFGFSALVLTCVGVSTPRWQSDFYALANGGYIKTGSANFFYACLAYANGSIYNCIQRNEQLLGYSTFSVADPWKTDYNQRMQNAGALCIVGILFLFFGTLLTLIMACVCFSTWITLLPPLYLFLACLFMLAGMAEGSRYLLYNDYSANLYQTGHLLSIFALFLSAFAAGRINFLRWSETND